MTAGLKLLLTFLCVCLMQIAAPIDLTAQALDEDHQPGTAEQSGELTDEWDRLQAEWAERREALGQHGSRARGMGKGAGRTAC